MSPTRPHSLALVLASLVPALVVVWSIDYITPILVGIPVITALVSWIPKPVIPWTRLGVVVLVAMATSVTSLLYARPSGTEYLHWGMVMVTDGSIDIALASFVRIVAIAFPAVLIIPTVEPHEMIATTVVHKVVPQRVALATLVALRLVPVIASDLMETRTARRASGLSTRFSSLIVTTLVIAIRRAIRMSEIADVRGFSRPGRIWTSYRPFRRSDWILLGTVTTVGAASLIITASIGAWNGAI